MNPSDPIAALEIGTTRTVIAIAEPLGEGRIRVAAYDGIPMSQVLRPRLTTYQQDADQIGRLSVRKLVEKIEHSRTCVDEEIPVTGKLMEGSSVAKLV